MAKESDATDSVYKIVEVVGTSTRSWEEAAKNAVELGKRNRIVKERGIQPN
jgi:flavin-binding protein dodecin